MKRFCFILTAALLALSIPAVYAEDSASDSRVVGPDMSPSEFLDETVAPFSETRAVDAPSPAVSSSKPLLKKSSATSEDLEKSKKDEGTVLPGGRIKFSGRYRLAAGFNGDDMIVNDANSDLQERNFRYLFGERLENTYDPAIYQKLLLNIDFSPEDKWNFYTQLVADPWSWVGTTGEQEIKERNSGSLIRPNLKYFGAFNSVLNETFTSSTGEIVATPLTKIKDGHTTAFTATGGFGGLYDFGELDVDYEFRPVRKMWLEYTEDQWHARVFALADQDQALTTDDPLELSNHKDYWQWSPWLEEYRPLQYFTAQDGLTRIHRGYYSNFLPYIAKDSEGNRLVLLRGASFEGDYGKTYLAATVASPYNPWQEDYFDHNNIPGAVRLKHQVTDEWMLGGVYTFRSGLIDDSVADFGHVVGVDTKYQINQDTAVRAEVAGSHRELDQQNGDTFRTSTEGMAYKIILDSSFDHKGDGHTDFLFSFTKMNREFDPVLSRYYTTKDDKFWGKHLTFREIDPSLEPFRFGDGVDVNRYVFRAQWKEKLFKERFINLMDFRQVYRSNNDDHLETVYRDELTYRINANWTFKGMYRYHGLPTSRQSVEPFISNFYFDSALADQTRPDLFLQNIAVEPERDPSRHTLSGGLQWVATKQLTLEGFVERTNDIPDFPRGLLAGGFATTPDRVDSYLLYRVQPFLYTQSPFGANPEHPYFTIWRQRVIYSPEDRVTFTLHAAQNSYKYAAGIDDNINHVGLSIDLQYDKQLSAFFDYTYSQLINVPRMLSTSPMVESYEGHHNVYLGVNYQINPMQLLRAEYGVFGYGLDSPYQPLISPYSGVAFSLPTIDTEHLFRVSLEGEF